MLRDGERLDDLGVNGWTVIQSRDDWRFSADTVRLAAFTSVRPGERILDLGMGDGALSLLLLAKEPSAAAEGIEIRPERYAPVTDSGQAMISSTFPVATTSPPCLPAEGPISTRKSASRMVSSSCSTTITEFPRSLSSFSVVSSL